MKLAISGKGGAGKSTLAAALSLIMAERGTTVLAVDADPDANLAAALGFTLEELRSIVPISKQVELIEERTGAKVNQYGQVFTMNPEVSDIADNYASKKHGVSLLVLGAIKRGGGGCACPENILLRALVADLILYKDQTLILDMEAGIEHLGRATVSGVDTMLIVVEPGMRSIEGANRIVELGTEIGITTFKIVANKVQDAEDELFIRESLTDHELVGVIPFSDELRRMDRPGKSALDGAGAELKARFASILDSLT
jgi:CO dehydrogenase maturation factor